MKKLLILQYSIPPYRYDFFNAISEHFKTTVCLFSRIVLGKIPDEKEYRQNFRFDIKYLSDFHLVSVFKTLKEVFSEIRKCEPDVVLVLECNIVAVLVILYKVLYWKKYRIVSIIDDSYDMVSKGTSYGGLHPIAEKIMIPLYDDIICVEPRVEAIFQQKYHKGICFPIMRKDENMREYFKSIMPRTDALLNTYNFEHKKVFLFVGRLVKIKNVQYLIESFIRLNNSNTLLVIVGEGEEEQQLKELSKGKDNILFTGRLSGDELFSWYNVADVFVLPSTMEPYGAVTNEALLAGCYAIVSCYAGSQCLITEGINGFVIDPYQQDSLLEAMRRTLTLISEKDSKCRKNMMPFSFEDRINDVINCLNS